VPALLGGAAMVQVFVRLTHIHLSSAAELLAAQSAGYAALFLVLLAIFRLQYSRPIWNSLGWKDYQVRTVWLAIAGLSTAVGVAFLAAAIRTPITDSPMSQLLKDRSSLILVAIFGVTLGPLAEELVFRGFVQPLLVRSLGPTLGIIAAALPFGLLHFRQYGNSWRHVLLIAAAGAAFGWIRNRTGSTRASTIMHGAYNAVLFVGLFLQGQASRD
jgi:membrane protease YdiL (CAAX protease family)